MTNPESQQVAVAPATDEWCWLAFYEDGHQHLEDLELTGEWARATAAIAEHGPIVALQIIPIIAAGVKVTVSVPADATPVMKRRKAIDLDITTGRQVKHNRQTIIGYEYQEGGGQYLHCWPNGEALMTEQLNIEPRKESI